MSLALRAAARSDVGLVRASNQDSGYAGVRFLVVADGMGGHAGGDVASAVAVAELIGLDDESHGEQAPQRLAGAVARAQQAILQRVAAEPALAGMGTTVTALLRAGDRLVLAHLGDSRAYLLREGHLAQVTRDHTFVQRLVDEGRITPEEAEHHPQRNVILRVLGDVQSSPEPDLSVRDAQHGDRWLLCSDGLPRVVSDETIERTLREVSDLGECADRLVQLALRAGAPDNVTCVVADLVDDGPGTGAPDGAAATSARGTGGSGTRQVVGAAGGGSPRADRGVRVPTSPSMRAAVLGRSPAAAPVAATAPVALADRQDDEGGDDRYGDPATDPATDRGRDRDAARGADGGPDREADTAPLAQGRPADDDGGAHPPETRGRARWGLRLVVALVVVAVLGGGALAGSAWLGRQYFVADDGGAVAIYRGLPQDLGPIGLSSVVSRSDVAVADLPEAFRDQVQQTIAAADLADAESKVDFLGRQTTSGAASGSAVPTDAPTQVPTDAASALPSDVATAAPAQVAP